MADPGVFRGVEFAGPIDMRALGKRLTKLVPLPRPDDIEYLDEDAVVDLVSAKGLLSEFFPVFEHRPEQMQMIGAVARTFNNGGHLMVEGGTGVGKDSGLSSARNKVCNEEWRQSRGVYKHHQSSGTAVAKGYPSVGRRAPGWC